MSSNSSIQGLLSELTRFKPQSGARIKPTAQAVGKLVEVSEPQRDDGGCSLGPKIFFIPRTPWIHDEPYAWASGSHESDKPSRRDNANPQQNRNASRNLRLRRQHCARIPRSHISFHSPMENQRMHSRQQYQ